MICIASPLPRCLGRPPRPSNSFEFACLARAIRKINLTIIPKQAPGRTENCQIGAFAAYATTRGHALVDRELYLPKSWTGDRERCQAVRIPDAQTCATKGDLARGMILRALAAPLPIA
ncbi:transposase [Streptomyces spiralis]